jgi:hypothetical protein
MDVKLANMLLLTNLPSAYIQVIPLIIIALIVDALIVVAWYYLGVMTNNRSVKGSALNEFYQFIGTAVIMVITIGTLLMISTVFYTALNANPTGLMSSSSLNNLCTNIRDSSQLDIIGKTNSLLSGPSSAAGSIDYEYHAAA